MRFDRRRAVTEAGRAAALVVACVGVALAASRHVQASLVAEHESIRAGEPFWVGLRLKMEPGWHTYWKNPGDAGLPTRVKWTLPEGFEAGPTDDPDDPDVAMDPDDGLAWPDPEKIRAWWAADGKRFQPGARHFMGKPVSRAQGIDILKNGRQRQRTLAAHYLCLLHPGTPLFNTSAPAWRQQRLLPQM